MACQISLSPEELDDLESVINQDLDASREELHHTWQAEYKDQVKRQIERMSRVLDLIRLARDSSRAPAASGQLSASQAD